MRPAGGAADRPRRQECQDASHTLALDPADEQARVVVETIEVVLADHRVVPRLDLGAVSERPWCHDHYAITGKACAAQIMPTPPDGGVTGIGPAAAAMTTGNG